MLGRKRRGLKKNAPRNVDLDLLLVDTLIIQSTPLTLPHPRLHVRAFVLKPLLDLAPDVAIPGQGPARDFLESVSGPAHRAAGHDRGTVRPDAVAARRRADDAPPHRVERLRRCSEAPDMLAGKYRYVVIEGPIGAGKTSLSRRLAERAGAHMLLEQPQDNPFLERFYRDSARYALPTQMFFLFQRVQQLTELNQLDLFQSAVVSDFLLEKDRLFARLTLADDELRLYEQMHDQLRPGTASPDLVIYLQAPPGNAGGSGEPARQPDRVGHLGGLPARPGGQLHAVFPRLRRRPGADRQHRAPQSGRSRRGLRVAARSHRPIARPPRILQSRRMSAQASIASYRTAAAGRKPVTLPRLREMRANGEQIAMLTCYDASFAGLLDGQGVDCILVGDSLGMVIQGRDDTLPVTLEEMAYHARCVARGLRPRG